MADKQLTSAAVVQILREAAIRMQEKHVKTLRDLDALIGDGDLGITISKGFKAVEETLSVTKERKIGKILREAGMVFNEANPSTFGVFFATAFNEAAREVKDNESVSIDDMGRMFQAATQGIAKRGNAKVGDKTILDALVPAARAFQEAGESGSSVYDALQRTAEAARDGAEKTRELKARIGRARSFGDRTHGVQDPGATAVSLFLGEILDSFCNL